MFDVSRLGRVLFTAGLMGLAGIGLGGQFVPALQPALVFLGSGPELAYALNGLMLIAAVAMFSKPDFAHPAALVVGALWAFWIVLGHLPHLWSAPGDVVGWVSLSEVASIGAVAWLLSTDHPSERQKWLPRIVVGAMLVWFGVVHLLHREAIAGMIPGWIPGRDLWPWATGAANLVAGLSILTGIMGRLGGTLVGLMFASWIALVHMPRLIAAPASREEWTALALNVVLVGCAWTVSSQAFRRAD